MPMLSEDDLDLRDLSDEELALAWDLWFDLAQTTNDDDPPHTHGVFQTARVPSTSDATVERPVDGSDASRSG
jgi:hypothetical protein